MPESLKEKVVRGALWNGVEKFGSAIMLLVSNLVLARLLTPDDFGYVGMLMVFIGIADAIVDGGFGAALVQKQDVSGVDYSTIFYWNIFVSIVLYVILFLTAPLIASFYGMGLLTDILRVQGLVLLFNALSVIQRSKLQREMHFRKLAKINLYAVMAGTVTGIILAFMGLGVWSLVSKLLATSIISTLLFWIGARRQSLREFSMESFRALSMFGGFVTLANITNSIYQNVLSLVIGKCMSPAALGNFTQARKLEDVPRQAISSIVTYVTFPAFSRMKNEKDRLIDAVRKSSGIMGFVIVAFSLWLLVVAKPLVMILLTAKWLPCVPYFKVVCIYGILMGFIDLYQGVLQSLGRSDVLFYTGISRKVIGILLVLLGTLWSMKGILVGFLAGEIVGLSILSYAVCKLLGYNIYGQVLDIVACALPAICSSVLAFVLRCYMANLAEMNQLLVLSVFFVTVLVILAHVFQVKSGLYLKEQACRILFNGYRR